MPIDVTVSLATHPRVESVSSVQKKPAARPWSVVYCRTPPETVKYPRALLRFREL
jgi:hypothetical protein